jgi:hypothetical protein
MSSGPPRDPSLRQTRGNTPHLGMAVTTWVHDGRAGATLGATQTDDVLILRTSMDSRQERGRCHGLI